MALSSRLDGLACLVKNVLGVRHWPFLEIAILQKPPPTEREMVGGSPFLYHLRKLGSLL